MPKICIIVPVYKIDQYICRCVDSILSQSFEDFELFLVDDGSVDESGRICDEYLTNNDRVTIIHKTNGGLSDARNIGLELASSDNCEWISFVDGDDWVHKQYLEILYESCILTNSRIAVSEYVRSEGLYSENPINQPLNKIVTPEDLWCENQLRSTTAWGKLYAKGLWRDLRYPVGLIHEDEYTTYKLLFRCDKICVVNHVLYYYYINPNSIMTEKWTPKRLNQICATKQQYLDFIEWKNEMAAKKSLMLFYYYLSENIASLKRMPEYKNIFIKLYRELLKSLICTKSFRKKHNLNIDWVLIQEFPIYRYVLHCKSIVKKLGEVIT